MFGAVSSPSLRRRSSAELSPVKSRTTDSPMRGPKSKPMKARCRERQRILDARELELLESWIEARKPDSGTNPLAIPPPPEDAPVGRLRSGGFSPYAGCRLFSQLPISKKTQAGLKPKYIKMTDIQCATLPHSLCGRDILGASKTGSGKTLAFIIPVIEKLYRARWRPEYGVGCIIISPTKELARQICEELKNVGKFHSFSAGLLIGGLNDVDAEKNRVNALNILVCTPGRLLQHINETLECSQLQILVLDEADRILDARFKKEVNNIISQLPKQRQTLLFSATQTKSVKDLARLSLKDPEYISVHAESATATPERLKQVAIEVPLDQKLNALFNFIKTHLNKKILVFLTTCKQVKFVYEAFKKLRPGMSLTCLHGRMKQIVRMAIYHQFCEKTSVLFSTDVASRGLDFPEVDWVVQVDCPEDVPTYIHRVGRTARFTSDGKSVLFLMPSEKEMVTKLQAAEPKIPIQLIKAKPEKWELISEVLPSLLAKYPNISNLAKRAFITYLKSVKKRCDKEVFDVNNLPIEEYAASLGLVMVPTIRFMKGKMNSEKVSKGAIHQQEDGFDDEDVTEDDILLEKKSYIEVEKPEASLILEKKLKCVKEDKKGAEDQKMAPKVKKKMKINLHQPLGTRLKFDEDGDTIPPLAAAIADTKSGDGMLQIDKVRERYDKLKEEMKKRDKEDKLLHRLRLHEMRIKEKAKLKRDREEAEEAGMVDGQLDVDVHDEEVGNGFPKRKKIYYDNDDEEDGEMKGKKNVDCTFMSTAEQEDLALKLLSSLHS